MYHCSLLKIILFMKVRSKFLLKYYNFFLPFYGLELKILKISLIFNSFIVLIIITCWQLMPLKNFSNDDEIKFNFVKSLIELVPDMQSHIF